MPNSGADGVGDDDLSWAYDGSRLKNGNGGPTGWKSGDVVGVLLDLDEFIMSFS
jgi:hypothetical protein